MQGLQRTICGLQATRDGNGRSIVHGIYEPVRTINARRCARAADRGVRRRSACTVRVAATGIRTDADAAVRPVCRLLRRTEGVSRLRGGKDEDVQPDAHARWEARFQRLLES